MMNYFKLWRRKIGMLTLVAACALLGGWFRNLSVRDSCNIPTSDSSSIQLISGYNCLTIVRMWSSVPVQEMASFHIYRHEVSEGGGIHVGDFMLAGSPSPFYPKWPMFMLSGPDDWRKLMIFSIPYWAMIIPLTLLSAYLLLSKPRRKTEASIPAMNEAL